MNKGDWYVFLHFLYNQFCVSMLGLDPIGVFLGQTLIILVDLYTGKLEKYLNGKRGK